MTSEDSGDKRTSHVIFGAQQRRLRDVRGMTRQQLSEVVPYSVDLIRKVERGERRARPEYIHHVDEALQAQGLLVVAGEELTRAHLYPEWFEEYVTAEAGARRLQTYNTHVLHGLLQTESYARTVLSSHHPTLDEEEVEARVGARLDRQTLLTRKPTCMLSFVIEEWVLHRPVGGPLALKEQLERLISLSHMRHISIQVLPTSSAAHPGFDGPLTLLETSEGRQLGYDDGQLGPIWAATPDKIRELDGLYGIIRGEALNAEASRDLIKQLAGAL